MGNEVSMAGEISLPCATRSPLPESAAERALLGRAWGMIPMGTDPLVRLM